jgi:hypothetical protein
MENAYKRKIIIFSEQDTLLSRDTLLSPTKGEGPLVVASRPTIINNVLIVLF